MNRPEADYMKLRLVAPAWTLCLFMFLGVFLSPGLSGAVAHGENIIKIGLPEAPKTLNVWAATDVWSNRVLNQLVQPLYIREPNGLKLIPWLAADDPLYDPATLSYTIKIRPSKWSDGSEFTSHDVAFTGRMIKTFRVPRFISNWEFIKKIETPKQIHRSVLLKRTQGPVSLKDPHHAHRTEKAVGAHLRTSRKRGKAPFPIARGKGHSPRQQRPVCL